MNKFVRNMMNCPKSCFQTCEYYQKCLAEARGGNTLRSIINCVQFIWGRLFRKNGAGGYQSKEPYKPIHPSAIYKFSRTNNNTFELDQHIGKRLFEINRVCLEQSPFPLICSHGLTDDRRGMITRLTFLPELERKSSGVYNNHAMLVELSEDCKEMTMLFFENMGIYQTELLQRWNANKLCLDVEIRPLLDLMANKHISEGCMLNNVQKYALLNSLLKHFFFEKKGTARYV